MKLLLRLITKEWDTLWGVGTSRILLPYVLAIWSMAIHLSNEHCCIEYCWLSWTNRILRRWRNAYVYTIFIYAFCWCVSLLSSVSVLSWNWSYRPILLLSVLVKALLNRSVHLLWPYMELVTSFDCGHLGEYSIDKNQLLSEKHITAPTNVIDILYDDIPDFFVYIYL